MLLSAMFLGRHSAVYELPYFPVSGQQSNMAEFLVW